MASDAIRAICLDWGGTLMSEDGPVDLPMALWPEVRSIDGAQELLARLHGRWPLAIATNATVSRRPMIEQALERAGLRRYIDAIFCATELGLRKENPAFWQAVGSHLGLPLPALAMLGDTLAVDVLAPQRLGIFAVWFNEGGRQTATCEVPTVTRLPDFAALVEGRP